MSFAFIRNALSQSSLMVLALHCELHLSFIKKIFSQHQPLVFTNIGKANVTKHKKMVQNYLQNYLQRLYTRNRWVLILYATEHCYLTSQKWHVPTQSAENHRKECHRLWLHLRHAVILISNDRTSASKKINGMRLIQTLTVSTIAFKRTKE